MNSGTSCIFTYSTHFKLFPDYRAHSGQQVTIVRELVDGEEYDNPGTCNEDEPSDRIFLVRAADGWEGHAWESELEAVQLGTRTKS